MTRVLFCVIPEKGHTNPMIGPAQALQDQGAEVVFHAETDIADQLLLAGIQRFVGPGIAPPPPNRGAAFVAQIRDAAWLRQWIREMLVDTAEARVEPLREVIRDVRPDVVAIDPMIYAAAIASEHEGVPWAALSNSLNPALPADLDSELLRTVAWLGPARAQLFARHGMTPSFRGCDVLSPHLTVAFTTRELVGDVADCELVGPSLPRRFRGDEQSFPFSWLDPERPLVYLSFGSQIGDQPDLIRSVIDAVAHRPVQLVVAGIAPESPLFRGCSDNVLLRRYVPQLELLGRARVMITHGGANSVMEAIAAAVPLALVPLCNDQFHQAHFLARAGIGRVLDAASVTAAEFGVAIDALLADGPERRNLAPMTASYARDGAGETARLLSELAARSHQARVS